VDKKERSIEEPKGTAAGVWAKRLLPFLQTQSRTALVMESLALVVIVGVADYLAGFERSFLVFYLFPIGLGAWFVSWRFAVILCVLSVTVWITGDIAAGAVYSSASVPFWNAGIAAAFFLIVTALLKRLRSVLNELEDRVRQRTTALRGEIEKRKGLEKDVAEVTERERRRIGHELHDTVCQHLTATSLALQVLRSKLAEASLPQTEDADRGVQLVEDTIELTRKIAQGLFPLELEGAGLPGALVELCRSMASRYCIKCEFKNDLPELTIDSNTATHLYRIAQEAVTNATKHGHVSRVSVELTHRDGNVILNVSDDGIGFVEPLPESRGLGLRIMSSRAGMIGGSLSVKNHSGGGVTVTCRVLVSSNEPKRRKDLQHVRF
jgi:signal transduction histidine kinase